MNRPRRDRWRSDKMAEEKLTVDAYFVRERDAFTSLATQANLTSHLIGVRTVDVRRVWASWLFIRACVTAKSIERLLTPHQSEFGDISYLDHSSIASLTRGLIENVAVLLYLSDTGISNVESQCRKLLIDLHDYKSRRDFLRLLGKPEAPGDDKIMTDLQTRLRNNQYFQSLSAKKQKRLWDAEDMYINGRMNALKEIGWSEDDTRAIYKYLSMQAHTMPMSFHRTEINRVYSKEAKNSKVVSGFALEHGRQALGAGCVRMFELFPDVPDKITPTTLAEFKSKYGHE